MNRMKLLITILTLVISINGIGQSVESLFNAGEKSFQNGNYERAAERYSEALKLDPNHNESLIRRAFCYNALKQYDKSVEDYSAILKSDPNNINALLSRGGAYSKLEKYDLAIEDFNKVIELDKKFHQAYADRGEAKKYLGDKKGACDDWKTAKKLGNSEAKLILHNNNCK